MYQPAFTSDHELNLRKDHSVTQAADISFSCKRNMLVFDMRYKTSCLRARLCSCLFVRTIRLGPRTQLRYIDNVLVVFSAMLGKANCEDGKGGQNTSDSAHDSASDSVASPKQAEPATVINVCNFAVLLYTKCSMKTSQARYPGAWPQRGLRTATRGPLRDDRSRRP